MRALLDLIRKNRAAVQDLKGESFEIMIQASVTLTVLDPEFAEEGLLTSWQEERATLFAVGGRGWGGA